MNDSKLVGSKFTDEHYIALGKLVIAFQSLEQTITYGLAFLMCPEDRFKALGFTFSVLNEHSFANRLKLLSNYVETHTVDHFAPPNTKFSSINSKEFPELLKELRLGIKIALSCEEKRNQLIHSYWFGDSVGVPPGTVMRMKYRAKHSKNIGSTELVTAKAIQKIVDDIDQARNLIFKTTNDLNFMLASINHPSNKP